jgi:hypothetical protein
MKAVGDTFIVPNPSNKKDHFYIVIGLTEKGDPIAVNLTTTDIDRSTCFLDKGDHPWITQRSAVNFWDVKRPMILAKLEEGARHGIVKPRVPIARSVVNRIIEAAQQSRLFPETLRRYLNVQR